MYEIKSGLVEELGLGVGDKTKSELELELPPALRAVASKQQAAAFMRMHVQPQKPKKPSPLTQARCFMPNYLVLGVILGFNLTRLSW